MGEQYDLYTGIPPYQVDSEPSRDAAEAILDSVSRLQGAVLRELMRCGDHGATDREIQAATGLSGSTERPRRVELVALGLVVDSGRRRNRSTVWVVKEVGQR